MDQMEIIKATFFQECEEQLVDLETGMIALDEGTADGEIVNAMFRAVHSIKGGAGAFHLDALVNFAHTFETTLDQMRNGRLAASEPLLKTMFRAKDVLADLVKTAREGGGVDPVRSAAVIEELKAHSGEKGASKPAAAVSLTGEDPFGFVPLSISFDDFPEPEAPPLKTWKISFTPEAELYRNGNEATRLLRELVRLGTVATTCVANTLPPFARLDPEAAYLSFEIELVSDCDESAIREIFEFVDTECRLEIADVTPEAPVAAAVPFEPAVEVAAAPEPIVETVKEEIQPQVADGDRGGEGKAAAAATPTIRVDLDRVDRLINLVGEMTIAQAMLSQRVSEAGYGSSSTVTTALSTLEQLTREIQDGVMAIRAQPVKPLFQRMSRIVRELADATGKSVRLRTEGEGTEVDRTVIERLADPLTHMIRNAVDHGLESPEAREAAGKSSSGEIRLSAAHRSGRIVIDVSDDGAGINRPRVRQIAVDKGLVPADAVLTDGEIDNLLFLPGFSTAKTISNISGRGVGMDVVKRAIQALGGRIAVTSRPGEGSTFSMSLPLTLAVLDGLVVSVADQTLIVPLTAIVETLRPKNGDIRALGPDALVVADRDGFVPLIDVGLEFGYRRTPADPMNSVILLVETEISARRALMFDDIQDQRQVVIKSLETNYGRVTGIAAATILGDGSVALILDVDSFVRKTAQKGGGEPQLLAAE